MRNPKEIQREEKAVDTLVELTNVFEGIASMRIAQIKNQVLQATAFFSDLWHIYTQLRVDSLFRFGRSQSEEALIEKELYIIITAEGGFSGDIDQKLVDYMLENYDKNKQDILVVGHHGALKLQQRGISYIKYFVLPSTDTNIDVSPIIKYIKKYQSTTVFYQQYVSLMVQIVRRIELSMAVAQQGEKTSKSDEFISSSNTIFEPSTYMVIDHLESSMMSIALGQLIFDSKLAQYASRFRAMSASHTRAQENKDELHLQYNRSKRAIKDQRLKEIINGIRKAGVKA
jgi:ATP synthase F1 gamma subunit